MAFARIVRSASSHGGGRFVATGLDSQNRPRKLRRHSDISTRSRAAFHMVSGARSNRNSRSAETPASRRAPVRLRDCRATSPHSRRRRSRARGRRPTAGRRPPPSPPKTRLRRRPERSIPRRIRRCAARSPGAAPPARPVHRHRDRRPLERRSPAVRQWRSGRRAHAPVDHKAERPVFAVDAHIDDRSRETRIRHGRAPPREGAPGWTPAPAAADRHSAASESMATMRSMACPPRRSCRGDVTVPAREASRAPARPPMIARRGGNATAPARQGDKNRR